MKGLRSLKMLDLFSGIGGMSLAAEWAGIETVAFCEIEPYCQQVLKKHWPHIPIYDDIRQLTRERLEKDGVVSVGKEIDIICGGYPCQPFSVAGKRRGAEDDRHLWPEMFRLVRELRPTWVVGENVAGHVSLGLDDVLSDLESEGYTCRAFVVPAVAVGAPHRRDRVFIVGYTASSRREKGVCEPRGAVWNETRGKKSERRSSAVAHTTRQLPHGSREEGRGRNEHPDGCQDVANTSSAGCEECNIAAITSEQRHGSGGSDSFGANRSTQPRLGGVLDGLPDWLDGCRWPAPLGQPQYDWEPSRVAVGIKNRVSRLKALGNAVVPQQVYPILAAIKAVHEMYERGDTT